MKKKKCLNCGHMVSADASFCTNCGKPVSMENSDLYCMQCGAKLTEDMNFCTQCGSPVPGRKVKKGMEIKRNKPNGFSLSKIILVVFLAFVVMLVITRCFRTDKNGSIQEQEKIENSNNRQVNLDLYANIRQELSYENDDSYNPDDLYYILDNPVWSSDFLKPYVEYVGCDLNDMWNYANQISQKAADINMSNGYYLKESASFMSETYYQITSYKTKMLYYGDLVNNKPDGFGLLADCIEMETDNGDETFIHIKYIGYLDEGRPDGIGIYVKDLPSSNDMFTLLRDTDKPQAFIEDYLSPIRYIGEIDDGEFSGKGVLFTYSDVAMALSFFKDHGESLSDNVNIAAITSVKDLTIYYGDFKDNQLNGDVEIYYMGKLFYKGQMENDTFNGKGTSYYPASDQKKYEGEFKDGKYNGQGTSYDEYGQIVYSGNWKMGDYSE